MERNSFSLKKSCSTRPELKDSGKWRDRGQIHSLVIKISLETLLDGSVCFSLPYTHTAPRFTLKHLNITMPDTVVSPQKRFPAFDHFLPNHWVLLWCTSWQIAPNAHSIKERRMLKFFEEIDRHVIVRKRMNLSSIRAFLKSFANITRVLVTKSILKDLPTRTRLHNSSTK